MTNKKWTTPLRIKELGVNGAVCGYASVFDEVDAQQEVVARGAFARSLQQWKQQGRALPMLWMHDAENPVGVWQHLREDMSGLVVEGMLATKTQSGADAYELLKIGAVTGLSIGYRVRASRIDGTRRIRTLTDIDLHEVSLVTFPANAAARITRVKAPLYRNTDDDLRDIVLRLQETSRTLHT